MKKTSMISGFVGIALLSTGSIAQDVFVYESVDGKRIHDVLGRAARRWQRGIDQDAQPPDRRAAAVNSEVADMQEVYANVAEADAERNAVDAENRQIAEENEQIRQQNCEAAKANLQLYLDSRRLYRVSEDGEREYLNDEELETEWAKADRDVEQWCGGQ